MASVRRSIPHFAVTFALGLVLVRHQIAGDECEATETAMPIHDFSAPLGTGEERRLGYYRGKVL